jgi:transposase-like protein
VKYLRRELIYFISLSALPENFTLLYVLFHRLHSKQFHGVVDVWKRNFNHVEHFFDYGSAVRKVMCITNAVESINSSFRKVTKKGAFPNENALLKLFYLRTTELYKK